jgi:hypothetical protein
MKRRALHVLAMTLVASLLAGAQAASAAPVDLICPSAATLHFTPGVGLGSQPVQITGSETLGTALSPATPCSSVLTGVPYTGGTGQFSGSGTFGCLAIGLTGLTGGASGTVLVTWNNGDTSTISWSLTLAGAAPIVSASVTAGALRGSSVVVVPLPTGFTGNCLLTPVVSISFAAVTAFAQL